MAVNENDPYGDIKDPNAGGPPEPRVVNNFHARSDLNSDQKAQHHSLGLEHNQASPGDHIHDGVSSRLIGDGLNLQVHVGGATQADIDSLILMLHSVIDFDEVP